MCHHTSVNQSKYTSFAQLKLILFRYKTDESDDEPFSMDEDGPDSCLPTSNLWKGKNNYFKPVER